MGIKFIRTETKPKEFSKKVITAMTFLWFFAAAFGCIVVWVKGYGLEALLSYVGAPMTGGIIGYMIKSAMENREKIKNSAEIIWEEDKSLPKIGFDGNSSEEGEDHP